MALSPVPDMPAELVLWDVVEEHLSEAEFLFEQWEAAMVSPLYTLEEVAKGPEERLLAHIDGLVVGGSAVAERLLIPALEELEPEEPMRTRAAALALLEGGPRYEEVVFAALDGAEGERRRQIVRALGLCTRKELDRSVLQAIRRAKPELRARYLQVLADRQVDAGVGVIRAALASGDREGELAGLRAALSCSEIRARDVEGLLGSGDPEVRDEAMTTGVMLKSQRAWALVGHVVRSEERPSKRALLLAALHGDRAQFRSLQALLKRREMVPLALWALGYTGDRECIEACLPFMGDEDRRVAKLAGEAVAAFTGLDMTEAPYGVEEEVVDENEEEDGGEVADLDADLMGVVEDELPLPNVAAVMEWWAKRSSALGNPEEKTFRGQAASAVRRYAANQSGMSLVRGWAVTDPLGGAELPSWRREREANSQSVSAEHERG